MKTLKVAKAQKLDPRMGKKGKVKVAVKPLAAAMGKLAKSK